MRTNRIITFALAIGVSGSLLTSCGDDTEALSKSEFVEQADAICQTATETLDPIFEAVFEVFDDVDPEDAANENLVFERFAEAAVQAEGVWSKMASDIRGLQEPDEDHDLIETLLDDLESSVEDLVATTAAAASGDPAAMQAISNDTDDPFADVNRRAREYGLAVCGQDGS